MTLLKLCVGRIGLARIVEVAPARRISARHQLTAKEVGIRDVGTMNGHGRLKRNAGPGGRVLGDVNFRKFQGRNFWVWFKCLIDLLFRAPESKRGRNVDQKGVFKRMRGSSFYLLTRHKSALII